LREVLDQEADRSLLLSLATDAESARFVADSITAAKPGFWLIALELCRRHPTDESVRANLTAAISMPEHVFNGTLSDIYRQRKVQVDEVLADPATPAECRTWLRRVSESLDRAAAKRVIWEYDVDIYDLRRYVDDRNSPQRIWAIGRILKYANISEALEILSPEDIAEALPQVDLPERKRKALERALPVWLNA
jgi:hypothetical protein